MAYPTLKIMLNLSVWYRVELNFTPETNDLIVFKTTLFFDIFILS